MPVTGPELLTPFITGEGEEESSVEVIEISSIVSRRKKAFRSSFYTTVRRDPNIVAYWRLNDSPESSRALDWGAKYNLNGIYDGSPLNATSLIYGDKSAGSKIFGFSGKNIEIPDTVFLRITSGISIEMWVCPYETSQTSAFLSKMNESATFASPYYFGLIGGVPIFSLGNGITSFSVSGNKQLPIGSPSHIVASFYGKKMMIIINNTEVVVRNLESQEIKDSGKSVFIGALSNNTKRFNGSMSEVALFNAGLSINESVNRFEIGRQVIQEPAFRKTFNVPSYSS